MESNNPNISEEPVVSNTPPTELNFDQPNYKWQNILALTVLLLLVGGGSFYLGTLYDTASDPAPNLEITTPTPELVQSSPEPSPEPNIPETTWETESVEINKQTEVSGDETITLSWERPSEWNLEIIKKPNSSENLIQNCADYMLTNTEATAVLKISPVCTGWGAEYAVLPQTAVTVTENSQSLPQIVRVYDAQMSVYKYLEAEADQVVDAVMVEYDPEMGKFLPVEISLEYAGPDADSILEIADRIISSLQVIE